VLADVQIKVSRKVSACQVSQLPTPSRKSGCISATNSAIRRYLEPWLKTPSTI